MNMFALMHAESVLQILDLLEQRLLPIIKRLVSPAHQCHSPRPSMGGCCQAGWYGAQGVSVSLQNSPPPLLPPPVGMQWRQCMTQSA
jgi:hypothetical protein